MRFKLVLFSTAFFFVFSCDPADKKLRIVNKTNSDVYFFYSCDSTLDNLFLFRNGYYKDTKGDSSYVRSQNFITKDSIIYVPKRGINAWNNYIENCKNKKIHFYFFSDSVVEAYSDNEIRQKNILKKHMEFSKEELDKIDWIIEFQ